MGRRNLYKLILLVCITISMLAMLYTNNDFWILPAAIFTIAFFCALVTGNDIWVLCMEGGKQRKNQK